MTPLHAPRDPAAMLAQTLAQWDPHQDLWLFGYGSLICGPTLTTPSSGPPKCTAGTER